MSKLFFDHLLVLGDIESEIKKSSSSPEEREELYGLVDEIINHKVMEKILDKIPEEDHNGFWGLVHKCPHDEVAIFGYLNSKAGRNIEKELGEDLKEITHEILKEIKSPDEFSNETKLPSK